MIAGRAGVTKGALYFHFAGKQSLAEAVIAEMISVWKRVVAEVETQGLDPLSSLIIGTGHAAERMLTDPIVRGGTRLLNDPAVATTWAGAHYRYARDTVRAQLTAAAAAGLLRPRVDLVVLARSVVTLVAGHNLVCERTDTLGELPAHISDMWRALLPLIATEPWLALAPGRPPGGLGRSAQHRRLAGRGSARHRALLRHRNPKFGPISRIRVSRRPRQRTIPLGMFHELRLPGPRRPTYGGTRPRPSSTRPPPRPSPPTTTPLSPARADRPGRGSPMSGPPPTWRRAAGSSRPARPSGRALPAAGDSPPACVGSAAGGIQLLPHLHEMVNMITSEFAALPWPVGLPPPPPHRSRTEDRS